DGQGGARRPAVLRSRTPNGSREGTPPGGPDSEAANQGAGNSCGQHGLRRLTRRAACGHHRGDVATACRRCARRSCAGGRVWFCHDGWRLPHPVRGVGPAWVRGGNITNPIARWLCVTSADRGTSTTLLAGAGATRTGRGPHASIVRVGRVEGPGTRRRPAPAPDPRVRVRAAAGRRPHRRRDGRDRAAAVR